MLYLLFMNLLHSTKHIKSMQGIMIWRKNRKISHRLLWSKSQN